MFRLNEVILRARSEKKAIGHFNISDLVALKAIVEVVRDTGYPVIIGVSEGERDFVGVREVALLIKRLREEENLPIYLNADHTYSLEKIKEVVASGFDSVIFDGAKLTIDENINKTREVVDYVKRVAPDIIVEAELGYIGSSSNLLDKLPEGAALDESSYTKAEDALRFVNETGVQMFAPAFGNIHGMFSNAKNPQLSINRLKEIREKISIPLVLHGGSGISDEDFKSAIKEGISIIHINTELRVAWRKGLMEGLKNEKQVTPYKILIPAVNEVKIVVLNRLKLFNQI